MHYIFGIYYRLLDLPLAWDQRFVLYRFCMNDTRFRLFFSKCSKYVKQCRLCKTLPKLYDLFLVPIVSYCNRTAATMTFSFQSRPTHVPCEPAFSCFRALFRRRHKKYSNANCYLCASSPSSASTCLPEHRALTEEHRLDP